MIYRSSYFFFIGVSIIFNYLLFTFILVGQISNIQNSKKIKDFIYCCNPPFCPQSNNFNGTDKTRNMYSGAIEPPLWPLDTGATVIYVTGQYWV